MAKKGQLFLLIKSLTKAEKRYFKLYATAVGSSKNYTVLFDAIDKQEVYDEQAIKKKFKGQAFINQLHVTKNHLSKLIMKSLRNFHAGLSKDAELKDLLKEVEILFQKELYDQCHYTLQKAEDMATTYEKHTILIEVLSWRRKLALARQTIYGKKDNLVKLTDRTQASIASLEALNGYWNMTFNITELGFGDKAYFNALANDPRLNDLSHADTIQSKVLYYHLRYVCYTVSGDEQKGEAAIDDLVALLEEHPHRIKEDPSSYITGLNNKISMLLFRRDTNAIPALLEKVRGVPEKYGLRNEKKITVKLLARTYNIELEMYRDTEALEKGAALIEVIQQFLNDHKGVVSIDYRLSFYYQFAYIYFLRKEYARALPWLNRILNENFMEVKQEIQTYARMLNLIIHFELDNIMILKYAVDSTRRFLKKKRDLHEFETILLKFFSHLSTANRSDYTMLFEQLQNDLLTPGKEKVDSNVLDYLNFKQWIESRLLEAAKPIKK